MNSLLTVYFLNKKQNTTLIVLSIVSIALLLLRVKISHSFFMLFLIWNLLLAIIPYSIASHIKSDFSIRKSNYKNIFLMIIWILFIPNSFYLITDFVHLYHNSWLQFTFDFTLLLSFTIAGFYTGILSILNIKNKIETQYNPLISRYFIITISYLSAFGVYIGRVLRFNSWDIISNPISLFTSTLKAIHIESLVFTMILGVLILLSIVFIQKFNYTKND